MLCPFCFLVLAHLLQDSQILYRLDITANEIHDLANLRPLIRLPNVSFTNMFEILPGGAAKEAQALSPLNIQEWQRIDSEHCRR